MSVSREDIRALVDGELEGTEAARVADAIAADPALDAQRKAEEALRAQLKGHLEPIAQEPVPDSLTALIAQAEAEDAKEAAPALSGAPAPVLDFAAAKARREEERAAQRKQKAKTKTQTVKLGRKGVPMFARPGLAAGLAASLVLGVMLGFNLHGLGSGSAASDANIAEQGGQLVAAGDLAQGLETQLASAPDSAHAMRVLTSFRRDDGSYCRVFSASATSGIACHEGGEWILERTLANTPGASGSGEYHQAGSAQADLMAAAQAMAQGEPLNAEAELEAREKGWR